MPRGVMRATVTFGFLGVAWNRLVLENLEPLAGFEPATYGLRRRSDHEHPSESSRSFDNFQPAEVDPRASSHMNPIGSPSDFLKLWPDGFLLATA
jgi:hypothetical protein